MLGIYPGRRSAAIIYIRLGWHPKTTVRFCFTINREAMIPEITLEDAEQLAMTTDYACFATGAEINTADAGAFFLEGYNYARREMENERDRPTPDQEKAEILRKTNGGR